MVAIITEGLSKFLRGSEGKTLLKQHDLKLRRRQGQIELHHTQSERHVASIRIEGKHLRCNYIAADGGIRIDGALSRPEAKAQQFIVKLGEKTQLTPALEVHWK